MVLSCACYIGLIAEPDGQCEHFRVPTTLLDAFVFWAVAYRDTTYVKAEQSCQVLTTGTAPSHGRQHTTSISRFNLDATASRVAEVLYQ